MTESAPKRPQNRDPKTGRLLPRGAAPAPVPEPEMALEAEPAEAEAEPEPEIAEAEPAPAPEPFRTVRVWTGGPGLPQEKIYMEGHPGGLKPGRDGAYLCDTPEKLAAVKAALKGRFWPDSVPDGEPAPRCETCGWTCRSYAAMNYHLNQAHGRPQA